MDVHKLIPWCVRQIENSFFCTIIIANRVVIRKSSFRGCINIILVKKN